MTNKTLFRWECNWFERNYIFKTLPVFLFIFIPSISLGQERDVDFKCTSQRSVLNSPDIENAIRLCEREALVGNIRAYPTLAFLYAIGDRVGKDPDKAVHYWKEGAKAREPTSLRMLGALYENGQWVEKNVAKAIDYYADAASLGDEIAFQRLKIILNTKE